MVGGSGGDDDEEGRCKPVNTYHSILLPYQKDKANEGYGKEYGKRASRMNQCSRFLAYLVKGAAYVPRNYMVAHNNLQSDPGAHSDMQACMLA